MAIKTEAPWHGRAWDAFINRRLPRLLGERLPLDGYYVEDTGAYTCAVRVLLGGHGRAVEVVYAGIPRPDARGLFKLDGVYRVVVPVAEHGDLACAEIRCMDEQLAAFIGERLGEAPENLVWDDALVRSWMPLDKWMREFHDGFTSQVLSTTNWLDWHTHLRRVYVVSDELSIAPGQFGRVCPFCIPEGPNLPHVREVAQGAEIRDGRLVVVDERPEAGLGLGASMVPFLEHSDSNRLLMGVNMMRQWMGPPDPEMPLHRDGRHYAQVAEAGAPDPEPALVRTGNEPDTPYFWAGYNVLTAYMAWDGGAFEDAIVLSESCAKRMAYPFSLEVGDKLSNRHGSKGVVGRVLPDAEMPHLEDGTPVELIFSLCSLPSRMNFGQVREAVMGRIARVEGRAAVVPPFGAPDDASLRARLREAGLPEDGMEVLTVGGKKLGRPTTVGWVYWGRTVHIARDKLRASVRPPGSAEPGEAEYAALCEAGAFETIRELFNTCASEREDAAGLAERVAAGPVAPAEAPSAMFAGVCGRLAAAGIRAALEGEGVRFGFDPPGESVLSLAQPVPHPWIPERELHAVGRVGAEDAFEALADVNARVLRMVESGAPAPLIEKGVGRLSEGVQTYLDAALRQEHLQFGARALFAGGSVIVPDAGLHFDQVGIPEEMAWTLFGPLVARELGGDAEVKRRSRRASRALDGVMSRSWVVFYRAPALMPTSFLAFRPVRRADRAIGLFPLACILTNADFDGDLAAVFLPVSEAAQQEAGERLSLVGHLEHDLELAHAVRPTMDALFGLANLSLSSEGVREIEALAGRSVKMVKGMVTKDSMIALLEELMAEEGARAVLEVAERLMRRGFEAARESGASMGPFSGASLDLPPEPKGWDVAQWREYSEEVKGWIAAYRDFEDRDFGSVALLHQCGARGSAVQLMRIIGRGIATVDASGREVAVRHGWREGLAPEEMFSCLAGALRGLHRVLTEMREREAALKTQSAPPGSSVFSAKEYGVSSSGDYGVLARARRSERPGVVFARAAAQGQVDPLGGTYSRLFVGFGVRSGKGS